MNKLTKEHLRLMRDEEGNHRIMLMQNTTGNYLHTDLKMPVNDALLVRELLLDQEFTSQDVSLKEDDGYYRIILKVKNVNDEEIIFHGRKLNLNDAVYEIDELIS